MSFQLQFCIEQVEAWTRQMRSIATRLPLDEGPAPSASASPDTAAAKSPASKEDTAEVFIFYTLEDLVRAGGNWGLTTPVRNAGNRRYPCTTRGCDYTSSNIDSTRTHIRKQHLGCAFSCGLCSRRFQDWDWAKRHLARDHTQ